MRKIFEYSQEDMVLTMHSRDILHRPRGIILIESTMIRWFSRQIGGRGWSLLLEVIGLESTKIRWFL
jgi:hypothetical protein